MAPSIFIIENLVFFLKIIYVTWAQNKLFGLTIVTLETVRVLMSDLLYCREEMKKRYSLDSKELQEVISEHVKRAEKNYNMEVKSQNDK